MAKAARARPAPLHRGISDDIMIREILVRLPPKALLRCRAVCRTWRRATSGRDFLLAHHGHQPSLPILCGHDAPRYHYIHAFHQRHTGAQLQIVARLRDSFRIKASCDGLLILCHYGMNRISMSVCNPATRQHASLGPLPNYNILGMYLHRPTGEYRLLLPKDRTHCYVFVLGSDHPARYIGAPETTSTLHLVTTSVLVRDSLHWYPVNHEGESKVVLVFDTTTESFRHMHAPVDPTGSYSYILEMDDTIAICSCSYNDAVHSFDIWVLENYESEVWNYKYRLELSVAEIKKRLGRWDDYWNNFSVVSVDGDAFLLLGFGGCLLYDIDGKLVDSFRVDGLNLYAWKHRLKQTLVPHTFFEALQGYDVNGFPFT